VANYTGVLDHLEALLTSFPLRRENAAATSVPVLARPDGQRRSPRAEAKGRGHKHGRGVAKPPPSRQFQESGRHSRRTQDLWSATSVVLLPPFDEHRSFRSRLDALRSGGQSGRGESAHQTGAGNLVNRRGRCASRSRRRRRRGYWRQVLLLSPACVGSCRQESAVVGRPGTLGPKSRFAVIRRDG